MHYRQIGLRFTRSGGDLRGFTDSDWAVRHSTSGILFTVCDAAVSWSSKKQPTVALSSCEAEIMASSEGAKEAIYLGRFAQELGVGDDSPVQLATDNQAARQLSYNPEHHARTKHIERRHFFVREAVENHSISVPFVRSADNLADFLTKPLLPPQFFALRDLIMNVPDPSGDTPSRTGGC